MTEETQTMDHPAQAAPDGLAREGTRMILSLTLICTVCGFLLAGVRHVTEDRIEDQIMRYVKGPAVKKVLAAALNDALQDRRQITAKDVPLTVFIGRDATGPAWLAYETAGKGFGGELRVMVGYDLKKDCLSGVAIISHRETPGMGARVTEDGFLNRFAGKAVGVNFGLTKDGGEIDGLTGATISSRAVCEAIRRSLEIYPTIKEQVAGAE